MPNQRRLDVFQITDGFCYYCGARLEFNGQWHVEHKQPKSRGGSNSLFNLVPACADCNFEKSDMTAEEYLAHKKHLLFTGLLYTRQMWERIGDPENSEVVRLIQEIARHVENTELVFCGEKLVAAARVALRSTPGSIYYKEPSSNGDDGI